MTKTIALAAVCSLGLIASPALAAKPETQSMSVEYADLNLSSPEGLAKLDRRIDKAARKVCRMDEIQTGTRVRSANAQRCYEAAINSAKSQMAAKMQKEWRGG